VKLWAILKEKNSVFPFYLVLLWLTTVVGFHHLCVWPIMVSCVLALALPGIAWRFRLKSLTRFCTIVGFIAMIALLWTVKPSNNRDWMIATSVLPRIIVKDSYATIRGFRDFRWHSIDDFDPVWQTRTFDLRQLTSLDLIVEPFKDSDFMAHTMLGFGFEGGKRLIISVEARREKQETYSLIAGAFRQFELIYLFGDENDLLALRAVHRGTRVYEFPVKADQEFIVKLFLDLASSANSLHKKPKFYRSIRDNCTTTLVKHFDRLHPKGHVGLQFGTLFPARTGRLLHQMGYMNTTLIYEEAKDYFRTDERIREDY